MKAPMPPPRTARPGPACFECPEHECWATRLGQRELHDLRLCAHYEACTCACHSPAATVRQLRCRLCWAPIGRECTVSGPFGDHLARYQQAEAAGLISRADLAVVVAGLVVLAPHVVIPEAESAA
jgi:hypothetical protein